MANRVIEVSNGTNTSIVTTSAPIAVDTSGSRFRIQLADGSYSDWIETKGDTGVSVTTASMNASDELILTLSDGSTINVGNVKGDTGATGATGPSGANGLNGNDGDDGVGIAGATINAANELELTYTNGTVVNLGVVVGADGNDGANGANGADGRSILNAFIDGVGNLQILMSDGNTLSVGTVKGDTGAQGPQGESVTSANINAGGDLIITLSDGTVINAGASKGSDGANGIDGQDGKSVASAAIVGGKLQLTLSDGSVIATAQDVVGADAPVITSIGTNASNELVFNFSDATTLTTTGFSAKGDTGATGPSGPSGANGLNGSNGLSFTTATVDGSGNLLLTRSDGFIVNAGSVIGPQGIQGVIGPQGVSVTNANVTAGGILELTLSNSTVISAGNVIGPIGATGATGATGVDGTDGVGIVGTAVDGSGNLILTMSDATTINAGTVVGAQGLQGESIASANVDLAGNLIITLTDASSINAGSVIGPAGPIGLTGADGADGANVIAAVVDPVSYELSFTLSDGSTVNTGQSVRGEQGVQGDRGPRGWRGFDGVAGPGIATAVVNANNELILTLDDASVINAGTINPDTDYKGYWNIGTNYFKDDMVIYNGILYVANSNIVAGTAFSEGIAPNQWSSLAPDVQLTYSISNINHNAHGLSILNHVGIVEDGVWEAFDITKNYTTYGVIVEVVDANNYKVLTSGQYKVIGATASLAVGEESHFILDASTRSNTQAGGVDYAYSSYQIDVGGTDPTITFTPMKTISKSFVVKQALIYG